MKFTNLFAQNYIGARNVDIAVKTPILLVAGGHGQGKSSLWEAINHAFSGDAIRRKLKGEYKKLISYGEKKCNIVIQWEGGQASYMLPSDKHSVEYDGMTGISVDMMQMALPYVLDVHLFASMKDDQRRSLLFKLMRVKADVPTRMSMLEQRGCDMDKAKLVSPMLAAGFAAAEAEAEGKAKDCRAAWTAITGERYGSTKADAWVADAPKATDNTAALDVARAKLIELDQALSLANRSAGALTERTRTARAATTRLAELRTKSDQLSPALTAFDVRKQDLEDAKHASASDEKALADAMTALEEVQAKATGEDAGNPIACPCCDGKVEFVNGKLVKYVEPSKVADPEALAKLPGMVKTVATLSKAALASKNAIGIAEQAVAHAQRDIAAAEAATASLASESAAVEAPTADEITAANELVAKLTADRDTTTAEISAIEGADRLIKQADEKTQKAAKIHSDFLAWEKIKEALSPSGIVADLLEQAIGPFNAILATAAELAEWERVVIEKDMSITYGGQPYFDRSESEQYRADAMIAEAISNLSGLRFLCFDRFDMLLPKERQDMIEWMIVATESSIDSVIIFGAMQKPPTGMPDEVQVVWMQDGVSHVIEQKSQLAA